MSLANQLRAVADAFRPLRAHRGANEQLSGELYIREIILIASTRLVVKTENIYWNTRKMQITMETELCL